MMAGSPLPSARGEKQTGKQRERGKKNGSLPHWCGWVLSFQRRKVLKENGTHGGLSGVCFARQRLNARELDRRQGRGEGMAGKITGRRGGWKLWGDAKRP